MSIDNATKEKLDSFRALHQQTAAYWFDQVLARCDSPIERLFAGALLARFWDHGTTLSSGARKYAKACAPELSDGRWFLSYLSAVPVCVLQATVRTSRSEYRVDFAFVSPQSKVAVELDGHAFHERTKEQAARDKRRDRDLTQRGWSTLRFAGSEVWANPVRCLAEVEQLLGLCEAGGRQCLG